MGAYVGKLWYPALVLFFVGAVLSGCGGSGETATQAAGDNRPGVTSNAAADDLSVSVDSATSEVTVVAGGQGWAGLQSLLDKAFAEDGETTGKVARKWVADRDVLDANDIRRGLLRFSEGDERFLQRMNSAVTLGPVNDPEATIQIVVEYPIEMPEDRVQVQDADFVNLVTTMRGQDMPERDSQAWNDALKVGVVSGYVYL